jgi:hypothetical protein
MVLRKAQMMALTEQMMALSMARMALMTVLMTATTMAPVLMVVMVFYLRQWTSGMPTDFSSFILKQLS